MRVGLYCFGIPELFYFRLDTQTMYHVQAFMYYNNPNVNKAVLISVALIPVLFWLFY